MSPSLGSELHDGDHKQAEHSTAPEEENVPGARGAELPTRQPTSDTIAAGLPQSMEQTNRLNIVEIAQEKPGSHSSSPPIAPLTRKNLKRLENMVGSKGSKSSKQAPSRSSSKTRGSGQTSSTTHSAKTLSTTAVGFEDRLRRNGVLHQEQSNWVPPSNLDDLTDEFHRLRVDSPAPSIGKYRRFAQFAAEASNEREMGSAVERCLLKDTFMDPEMIDQGYRPKLDKQWLDYPRNQGFNNGLSNPKPDYIEGYKRSKFPPNISDLGGAVTLDNKAREFVALPHFAAEYKGRDASMDLARVQAGYDGAAMVHGRSIAMKSIGKADPPRHAAVATAATDGTTWHTYAHYEDENKKSKKKVYHQFPVASGTLDSYQGFQQGYRVLRNTQDFARRQSTEMLDDLNQHYDSLSTVPPSEEFSRGRRSRDSQSKSSDSRKRSNSAAPVLRSGSSGAMSIDTTSSKGKGKEVARPPPLLSVPKKDMSYASPTASSEAKRSPRAVKKSTMLPPQTLPSYSSSARSHHIGGKTTVPHISQSPSGSVASTSSSRVDKSRPPISTRGRPKVRSDLPIAGDSSSVRDSSKAPSGHSSRPPSRQTSRPPSRHTSRPPSRQDGPSLSTVVDSYTPSVSHPRTSQPRDTASDAGQFRTQLDRERSDSPRDASVSRVDRDYRERDNHHRRRKTGEHEIYGRRW